MVAPSAAAVRLSLGTGRSAQIRAPDGSITIRPARRVRREAVLKLGRTISRTGANRGRTVGRQLLADVIGYSSQQPIQAALRRSHWAAGAAGEPVCPSAKLGGIAW